MRAENQKDASKSALSDREIAALRESAERFAALTNLSPDIISIIAADGQLLFNSPAALRIHGYTTEEMVGKNTMEFVHPDDVAQVAETITWLMERPGEHASLQYRYRHRDGHYTWMEAHGYNQAENPLIRGLITISRDISERKQIEEQLRTALESRDNFLSIASHELKTPLTFLKVQLSLLERKVKADGSDALSPESLLSALVLSGQQVDRLVKLVKDLLDASRIRSGKLSLQLAEFDLARLVTQTVSQFRESMAPEANLIATEVPSELRGVWDQERIAQVVLNLLGNALRHAPGSPVQLLVENTGEKARIIVQDQGPGIPHEAQETIFERFERSRKSRDLRGLGLGLFITKCIVKAHAGEVRVASEPGQGATFTVELPLGLTEGEGKPLLWDE